MSLLVLKFGGNTLSSEAGIQEALAIIAAQQTIWDHLVVVTSALGGVTDSLHNVVQVTLTSPRHDFRQEVAKLRQQHIEIAQQVIRDPHYLGTLLQELDLLFFALLDTCDILREKKQADPVLADRILAMGEMWVTRILAAAGRAKGLSSVALDANRLIITDDRYSNARPIATLTQQYLEKNLLPLLEQHIIPIVTGYIGANEKGYITTLGRGGSDYSATYIGALLSADEIWFFTDVEGLMSADPAAVPTAHVLPSSSYKEVAEMARFGARVLHPHAIEPLIQANIPLRIRSLQNASGTFINHHPDSYEHRIHAVTQAVALQVIGPSYTNLAEVCNRLIAQFINDDIQPTLQTDTYSGTMLVYVAPTNVNQETFFKCADHLKAYEDSEEWQIAMVSVVAVIGTLNAATHAAILQTLAEEALTPLAFGQGSNNVFLLVFDPKEAETALQYVHHLIEG